MTAYKFDDNGLSDTYGSVVYADANDIAVLDIKPHAVQLASGDHRYDVDESFGHKVATALNCHDNLLAALKDACASLELQAETYRHWANVRDRDANLGLADELARNASIYRRAIAKAEGR